MGYLFMFVEPMAFPLFLMPSIGPLEIGVVFLVVLILFGPGKLPQVFRALGDGVRQFKEASTAKPDSLTSSAAPPQIPGNEKS